MTNHAQDAKFTQGNIMRHVTVMALTSSIGLMALFAVDLVDMAFIAMLGEDNLAAAAGYAATLLFFTNAINLGLSIAAGALISRSLGAGDEKSAREYATSVAIFALITGIILPIIILPNVDFFLGLLGAKGEVARLAAGYLWVILPSMGILGVSLTASSVLYSNGDARRAMFSTLGGGLVNLILDPIFIFVLNMGLEGAALASVFARIAGLLIALIPAITLYNGFDRPSLSLLKRDFFAVSNIAAPSVLTNLASPVGTALVTREMAKFGTEAIAGMAVVGRVAPVAFSVVFALSGAVGPIVGQNYGAQKIDRVKEAFRDSIIFTMVYVVIISGLLFFLRAPIANMFQAEGATRELIYLFCGPLSLVYIASGTIYIANASFNNLGHPIYSTFVNWSVHTLGTLPLILMFGNLYGAQGVLIGQAIGQVVFAIISFYLAKTVMNNPTWKVHFDPFHRYKAVHQLYTRGDR